MPNAIPSQPVFVYGSLLDGRPNHPRLQGYGAVWLNYGQTASPFRLLDLGYCPGAVADGRARSPVRGELYLLSPDALAKLDRAEGHPFVYTRRVARVVLDDGQDVLAWFYLYQPQNSPERTGPVVVHGCWSTYCEDNGGRDWDLHAVRRRTRKAARC